MSCAAELVEQNKLVILIGIGPGLCPGAEAKETHLRIEEALADGGGHGPLA
jgi:hypothetical protein